jgi:hypothetical protein
MARYLSCLSAASVTGTLEGNFHRFERLLCAIAAHCGLAPMRRVACNEAGLKS